MEDDDDVNSEEALERLKQGWSKLKTFKKLYKIIDVLGNIALIVALIYKQWIMAFLLFIMFFPDEREIVRFFKKVWISIIITYQILRYKKSLKSFKSLNPPENKESHEDNS